MSFRQSFIFHLINLVLGAHTSLGDHLGGGEVFIQNILVHWANEESKTTGALILADVLQCLFWASQIWRRSLACECVVTASVHFKRLEYSCIPKKPSPALHRANRVLHVLHGERSFLVMKWWDNDRKTEHLRCSSWWMELHWKFRLVSWTNLKLQKRKVADSQGKKNLCKIRHFPHAFWNVNTFSTHRGARESSYFGPFWTRTAVCSETYGLTFIKWSWRWGRVTGNHWMAYLSWLF